MNEYAELRGEGRHDRRTDQGAARTAAGRDYLQARPAGYGGIEMSIFLYDLRLLLWQLVGKRDARKETT